ncbi:MAG: hypothetical protein NTY14_08230 [Candidatus Omnitrophica bacterium]|nr:hypothetical protein [Candidatus Omnitrophota bacterium]
MKNIGLMILLLIAILVFPSLLFAGNLVDDFSSWATGAVSTVKSYTGGAVGWATANPTLGNQVANANWRQSILNNPGGVARTAAGAAIGAGSQIHKSIVTTNWSKAVGDTLGLDKHLEFVGAQQNLSRPTGAAAAAAKPIDFIGATKDTSFSKAGQKTMQDVTNFSAYNTKNLTP